MQREYSVDVSLDLDVNIGLPKPTQNLRTLTLQNLATIKCPYSWKVTRIPIAMIKPTILFINSIFMNIYF
tara:strand:- start:5388 stop:5597 length:210 start_codon:yes stop_codon:yes gene_type:complete